MTIRDIAVKNLLRRKTKAAFILAGLVIGVATVVAIITLAETMTHDINKKLEKFGANILIVPKTDNLTMSYGGMTLGGVSFDVAPLRQSELQKIQTIKNAANIAAIGPIVLGAVQANGKPVSLAGIDFQSAAILKPWWKIKGQAPGAEGVLAGAEAARIIGLSIGDTMTLKDRQMKISGILSPTGSQDDHLLFTHLATAQKILGKPGLISIVEIAALCHNCPVDDMVNQISAIMPSAKVMAIQQVVKSRMETLEHFKRFSLGICSVVVLIGGLVVLVTLMGSVKERTEEIGIFRAVGFRKLHIMRIIFLEAAIVSTLAGIIGYVVGMGSIIAGLKLAGKTATAVHADPILATGAIALAVMVGLAASAYPAAMASRMDPNQALKTL